MTRVQLTAYPPEELDHLTAIWVPRTIGEPGVEDWKGQGIAMIVTVGNEDEVWADEWADTPEDAQAWVDGFEWEELVEEPEYDPW